jgi:hypothetical protein|nr:MAG TPA: hypothetical protein [Caudoviricetes sp.]
MILGKNCGTPVSYWLSLPLSQLKGWIAANNAIVEEGKSANGK